MTNLCIIPARGGSKRIPEKNIRDFLGKPIIAYSIEAALASGVFDEVMVSTDDKQIAEIAAEYGAKVPFFRSAKNSDDFAGTIDVILEVLDTYAAKGITFKHACCIYPTAPLIQVEALQEGLRTSTKQKINVVFPVTAFSYPIWRGLRTSPEGEIRMIWPEHQGSRSQDLEEVYHDAGQWYWFNVERIKCNPNVFSDNTAGVILDPIMVQDIDNLADWKIAELKYEYLQNLK